MHRGSALGSACPGLMRCIAGTARAARCVPPSVAPWIVLRRCATSKTAAVKSIASQAAPQHAADGPAGCTLHLGEESLATSKELLRLLQSAEKERRVMQEHVAVLHEERKRASQERAELRERLLAIAEEHKKSQDEQKKAAEESAELRDHVSQLTKIFTEFLQMTEKENVGYRSRQQREGSSGGGARSWVTFKPTIAQASKQPHHVCEMGHQSLAELAMHGNHPAQRERLLREIMCADKCSWEEAHTKLADMDQFNERFYWLESSPYRIGIALAVLGAIGSFLFVFSKPVAKWYGTKIVGEELPEDIEQATANQVGTWTWNWMEPMIGTASFVLLCCQFSRAQLVKMNMKTYAEHVMELRANRLSRQFPKYDRTMTRAWAKHLPRCDLSFLPKFERDRGFRGPTSGL